MVVAAEVGGRFSAEANQLSPRKSEAYLTFSRGRLLRGCVVANSFALSLLGRVPPGADGEVPLLSDVLGAHRYR